MKATTKIGKPTVLKLRDLMRTHRAQIIHLRATLAIEKQTVNAWMRKAEREEERRKLVVNVSVENEPGIRPVIQFRVSVDPRHISGLGEAIRADMNRQFDELRNPFRER